MSFPAVTAIIQARMGSSRLPGKVLMDVQGTPLLGYLLTRIADWDFLEQRVVATTTGAEDDAVADYARSLGVRVYRGAEEDVLDRYYRASEACGAATVMRLTSDCPFLDRDVCRSVVEAFSRDQADYATTGPRIAEGLDCEVFSLKALEKAWKEAAHPAEREHVTLFFRNHPDLFRIAEVDWEEDCGFYRLTVDEPEDFALAKAVIEHFGPTDIFQCGFTDVRVFLDANPEVLGLNKHIVRNEGLARSLEKVKTGLGPS